jgi:hypothetical protein
MRPLVLSLVLVCGCGGSGQTVADLGMQPPDMAGSGCMPNLAPAFFVSSLAFLPAGQGFDLDGNGTQDNQIGQVGQLANSGLAQSIKAGTSIMLLVMAGLQGPPLVEGDMPQQSLFVGLDADSPPDPTNNANNGRFNVSTEQFDVNCNPTTEFDTTVVHSGVIDSTATKTDLIVGTIGTLKFVGTKEELMPQGTDLTTWQGQIGGIELACSLSITPFPGPNPASLLDVLVNSGVQPDMDRDGDGVEQIVGDGTTIMQCIDGDGTVIPGRNCPCDPRIADGYSGALQFTLVPATIVGIATSQ